MSELLLAGDLGGTKINLALFRADAEGRLTSLREATFPTQEQSGLAPVARAFLGAELGQVAGACCGVAGPVEDGHARMVNVPFEINAAELARELNLPCVSLVNDLVATGYGIEVLPPDRLITLQGGDPNPEGNGALLAAGTGLGKAFLLRDVAPGGHWRPLPSEGGHADFAPRTDEQVELLRYLRRRTGGPVDIERVVSGPGLATIFHFLRDTQRADVPAALATRLGAADDTSRVVSEAGLAGEFPICVRALELFAECYAAEAGNFALACLATGGVYLGGGIAPKILPVLQTQRFREAFVARDRMQHVMIDMPLHVITEPRTALLGAAHRAALDCGLGREAGRPVRP